MVENQVKNLWDLWPAGVEWFVIGGLSKDCDAQSVKARFPSVKCIGFEPHPGSFEAQRTGKGVEQDAGPFPGTLVNKALWSSGGRMSLVIPPPSIDQGRSSLCRPLGTDMTDEYVQNPKGSVELVETTTLADASREYGPFRNCVLWLDVEHAEWEVLLGAGRDWLRDDCLLINVETFSHTNLSRICDLLTPLGFYLMRTWGGGRNPGRDALDYVWLKGAKS